jgi:hypothetical protein
MAIPTWTTGLRGWRCCTNSGLEAVLQRAAVRAVLVAMGIAAVLGPLHWLGVGLRLLLVLGVVMAVLALAVPHIGVRLLTRITQWVRARYWAPEEGRFYSFGGVPLRIDDDGRHMWLDADGLQRVLGRREPEDALAARHAGHWQRGDDGKLVLRVDAVVKNLNTMPGRDEPRILRFRRYLEREVLFPAEQRRSRGRTG